MTKAILGAALIALSFAPAPVFAFGTVRGLHQNAEHERITRQALGCNGLGSGNDCLEKKTLKELAGADNNFGAIGIPDRGELVPSNRAGAVSLTLNFLRFWATMVSKFGGAYAASQLQTASIST